MPKRSTCFACSQSVLCHLPRSATMGWSPPLCLLHRWSMQYTICLPFSTCLPLGYLSKLSFHFKFSVLGAKYPQLSVKSRHCFQASQRLGLPLPYIMKALTNKHVWCSVSQTQSLKHYESLLVIYCHGLRAQALH